MEHNLALFRLVLTCVSSVQHLSNPDAAQKAMRRQQQGESRRVAKLPQGEIDKLNEVWDDNEITGTLYEIISSGDFMTLRGLLAEAPEMAHTRSKDGRGPMWWAHENGHSSIVKALKRLGVSEVLKDAKGMTPLDLSTVVDV
jgi:ankyrin repeat protein